MYHNNLYRIPFSSEISRFKVVFQQVFRYKTALKVHHRGSFLDGEALFSAFVSYSISKRSITISKIEKLSHKDLDVKPLDTEKTVVSVGLSSRIILARQVELRKIQKKELDSVLKFQIEPLLPYPLADCLLESVKIGEVDGADKYLVFSSLKKDLQICLEELSHYDINPEGLYPKPIALLQFTNLFFKDSKPKIFIDIGYKETTCIFVSDKKLVATRSLPLGIDQEVSNTTESGEVPYLKTLARELQRVLISFQNIGTFEKGLPICFTGVGEEDQLFLELLGKYLGHPTIQLNDIPKEVVLAEEVSIKDCRSYAIAIGLALFQTPFQVEKKPLNFRKEEFSFPNLWNCWKSELFTYFALTTSIALILFMLSDILIKKEDRNLSEKYVELCALLEKSPDEIEKNFSNSDGNLLKNERTSLATEEIEKRLFYIKEKFWPTSDEIPLHPNVPRVSDLIAWLCNHPKIKFQDGENGLKLESLSYTMVKRPEKGRLKDTYQARCDLEFTAQSATQAREFHDALTSPNAIVDPKSEVKWTVSRSKYQTSFFLKDRTQYP